VGERERERQRETERERDGDEQDGREMSEKVVKNVKSATYATKNENSSFSF
jgi:hypothetical protein